MTEECFDVIVIGGGAGASGLAFPAAKCGKRVCLIDKGPLGGTCLNRGCIPSKMLIYPARVRQTLESLHSYHMHLDKIPDADAAKLVHETSTEVDDRSRRLGEKAHHTENMEFIQGEAKFVSKKVLQVNGRTITATKIFLGVGSVPSIPSIPGLANVPYLTSVEALRLETMPKSMTVIGGGYIGCELGFFFHAMGVDVHILELQPELLTNEDFQVREEFSRLLVQKVHVETEICVKQVDYSHGVFSITYEDKRKTEHTLRTDSLLVATGYRPQLEPLNLKASGIEEDAKGNIKVNSHLQTTCEGVWAFGDCIGKYLFRHAGNFEANYLLVNALLPSTISDEPLIYPPMPHAIFSWYEVAGVGSTEDELKEENSPYVVGLAKYSDTGSGLAMKLDYGFAKLLVHPNTREILGCHILGPHAALLVHEVVAVMTMSGRLDDILYMIHIHPTMSELIRDAARDARAKMNLESIPIGIRFK